MLCVIVQFFFITFYIVVKLYKTINTRLFPGEGYIISNGDSINDMLKESGINYPVLGSEIHEPTFRIHRSTLEAIGITLSIWAPFINVNCFNGVHVFTNFCAASIILRTGRQIYFHPNMLGHSQQNVSLLVYRIHHNLLAQFGFFYLSR